MPWSKKRCCPAPRRVCSSSQGLYLLEALGHTGHSKRIFSKCPTPGDLSAESPSPGVLARGLPKGLADLLFGVVHAVPSAQLGHGVVESHLCF